MMKLQSVVVLSMLCGLQASSVTLAEGSVEEGQAKSTPCVACHGVNGNSSNPVWPNLADQHEQYIVRQLKAFKSGARQDPLMSPMAAGLSDDDVEDLAAYFDAQTLTGLEAERCTFEKCELEFAKLDGARLTGCTFRGCHAVGVHFEGALISGGSFPSTTLARTDWDGAESIEVDYRGTNFALAKFGKSRFVRCDLRGAVFKEAVLAGAVFDGCDLREATWERTALAGATFRECQGAPSA